MGLYTVTYILTKDGKSLIFNSEKEACKYIGVKQSSVSSSYYRKCKCMGYDIEKHRRSPQYGHSERIYRIWRSMKSRCNNKNHMAYKNYGGRGISICTEWSEYESFRKWALSNGYRDNLTIDRIDVNGNYCPENCRWATIKQQSANRRTNHYVIVNGERMIAKECERRYSIPKSTIIYRANHGKDILTGKKIDKE